MWNDIWSVFTGLLGAIIFIVLIIFGMYKLSMKQPRYYVEILNDGEVVIEIKTDKVKNVIVHRNNTDCCKFTYSIISKDGYGEIIK